MPGEYRDEGGSAEARLKTRLLLAHLKVAEAGGYDAALIKLVEIVRGETVDGQPIKVAPRTQAIAAARLAQLGVQVLPREIRMQPTETEPRLPAPATVNVDRSQHVHIHAGAPGPGAPNQEGAPTLPVDQEQWLRETMAALQQVDAQRARAASLGAAHSSGNGHAHTNGHVDKALGDGAPEEDPQ